MRGDYAVASFDVVVNELLEICEESRDGALGARPSGLRDVRLAARCLRASWKLAILSCCWSAGASPVADAYLGEILALNPGVESARLDWAAMAEMPEVVASLPDPVVSYGYYLRSVQTRTGAMRQRIGLAQKIPFPGKLGTAKARSAADAQVTYFVYRAAVRDVFAQGRTLLADLYRADAAVLILRDQVALLRQTAEAGESLVGTNQGSVADVIRSRVAAEEIETRISQLEAERMGVVARMAALRGDAEVATALSRYGEPELPELPGLSALMVRSLGANQDLEAARAAVARDDLGVRAAALEYYPDFTLGADYTILDRSTVLPMTPQNGDDPVMATVSVNVPLWWDKLGAQKRAAVARRGSSEARQAQLTADVSAGVQAAHAMARAMAEQRVRYAREIIPGARQAYESTASGYRSGSVSLTELLDVQRATLTAELGLIDRTAGYLRAVAELERAIGEPLDHHELVAGEGTSRPLEEVGGETPPPRL